MTIQYYISVLSLNPNLHNRTICQNVLPHFSPFLPYFRDCQSWSYKHTLTSSIHNQVSFQILIALFITKDYFPWTQLLNGHEFAFCFSVFLSFFFIHFLYSKNLTVLTQGADGQVRTAILLLVPCPNSFPLVQTLLQPFLTTDHIFLHFQDLGLW